MDKAKLQCTWCEQDIERQFTYNTPIMVILDKVTNPYYFDKKECLSDWIKGLLKAKEI